MGIYKAEDVLKKDIDFLRTAILSCLENNKDGLSEEAIWKKLPPNITNEFTRDSLSNMLALMLTEGSIVKTQ
jgi:hypothetical protein